MVPPNTHVCIEAALLLPVRHIAWQLRNAVRSRFTGFASLQAAAAAERLLETAATSMRPSFFGHEVRARFAFGCGSRAIPALARVQRILFAVTPGGPNRITLLASWTKRSVRNFPNLPLVNRRLEAEIELVERLEVRQVGQL